MKKSFYLLVCITIIVFSACSSSKNSDKQILMGQPWELEYLSSGPKIAFEGLFPIKKPQLTFNKENKTVSGNDGCNGYSAPFILEGKNISFGEPGPSTLMYCGEGEKFFRQAMTKIDGYKIEGKKLILLSGNLEQLRFRKTIQ